MVASGLGASSIRCHYELYINNKDFKFITFLLIFPLLSSQKDLFLIDFMVVNLIYKGEFCWLL